MELGEEKQIQIPWIILPGEEGASQLALVISAPDGTLIEFKIDQKDAERLPEVLASGGLWKTFFQSLIDSMSHQRESDAE